MNSGGNSRWVPSIIRTLILNFADNKILKQDKRVAYIKRF